MIKLRWPWKSNEKLIQELYEKIQALEMENKLANTIRTMKEKIEGDIISEITPKLSKSIAQHVIHELDKRKAGIV